MFIQLAALHMSLLMQEHPFASVLKFLPSYFLLVILLRMAGHKHPAKN